MYVYIGNEPGLWTVGFYDPLGKWMPESDHESAHDASDRVSFLNGGKPKMEAALRAIASLGGNISDENLESKTGPNDARHRGIMYTNARHIAREALGNL